MIALQVKRGLDVGYPDFGEVGVRPVLVSQDMLCPDADCTLWPPDYEQAKHRIEFSLHIWFSFHACRL